MLEPARTLLGRLAAFRRCGAESRNPNMLHMRAQFGRANLPVLPPSLFEMLINDTAASDGGVDNWGCGEMPSHDFRATFLVVHLVARDVPLSDGSSDLLVCESTGLSPPMLRRHRCDYKPDLRATAP